MVRTSAGLFMSIAVAASLVWIAPVATGLASATEESAGSQAAWPSAQAEAKSRPKSCRRAMWNTYYEPKQRTTYRIEKYICRGGQVYGRLVGVPGPVAIAVSLTADYTAWEPWYSIPVGYTPPRSSVKTNVANAGNLAPATYICLRTYTGFIWGCLNERDGYPNGPLPR